MKKSIKSLTLVFLIYTLSCDESDSDQRFTELIGVWEVEQALLDSELIEEWTGLEMEVSFNDDTMVTSWNNRPEERPLIWPQTSSGQLLSAHGEIPWVFRRDDGIEMSFTIQDEQLLVSFITLREWSYEEECPNDYFLIICSEQGKWGFTFNPS